MQKPQRSIGSDILPKYEQFKKLYWVSTPGREEDWFIIAGSAEIASSFHEGYEGFLPGDAKAKEICEVEKQYKKEEVYHAQLDMLLDMGFKILSEGPTRIVMKNGKTFREGTTPDVVIREKAYRKEGLYILKINGENKYKIGVTKDFVKRLSNLQTGSPYIIDVWNFYLTTNSRKIEKLLHNQFKHKSIGGEWFEFTEEDLERIHKIVLFLTKDWQPLSYKELIKALI